MSFVADAVGSLFGGSSSGAGASTQSSTSAMDPAIKNLFLQNYSNVQNAAGGLKPIQYAAPNSMMTGANGVASNLSRMSPFTTTAAQVTGNDINSMMNPYLQNVANTTMADLNRQRQIALNDNGSAATMAHAFGGSRQGVQNALTNEAYDRNTASTLANLYNNGYNTALGAAQYNATNQQNANLANLGSQNTGAGLQLNAAQQLYNMGLGQQNYDQNVLNAGRQNTLDQVGLVNQALGVNPLGGGGMTSTGTGSTQGQGLLGNAQGMGSLIGNGALAYLALSDENLKDNIKSVENPLGKLKALDGKTYSYKAKGTPSLGLIAQDVEDVMPDAVVDTPAGKAMSYPAVTGLLVSAVNELSDKIEKKGAKHGRAA